MAFSYVHNLPALVQGEERQPTVWLVPARYQGREGSEDDVVR